MAQDGDLNTLSIKTLERPKSLVEIQTDSQWIKAVNGRIFYHYVVFSLLNGDIEESRLT